MWISSSNRIKESASKCSFKADGEGWVWIETQVYMPSPTLGDLYVVHSDLRVWAALKNPVLFQKIRNKFFEIY